MHSKSEFRADLRKRRQVFVSARNSARFYPSTSILECLIQSLSTHSRVAGYAALPGEPDIFDLLNDLNCTSVTGLPFMAEADELLFRLWSRGEPLEKSEFGFRQPASSAPLLEPDAILVPLVGFDRALNRLGHGKGHYDRALVRHVAARKIGIAWSVQEVPEIPVDPWDVPLDAVITEREWIVR